MMLRNVNYTFVTLYSKRRMELLSFFHIYHTPSKKAFTLFTKCTYLLTWLIIGQYQCFAKNKWGVAITNSVFVRKSELNNFKDDPPKTLTVSEGDPFGIDCEAPDGWPKPNVYWMLQGQNWLKTINSSRWVEMYWKYIEVLEMYGKRTGKVPEMYWKCAGNVLEMYWKCIGNVMEMCWKCTESTG